MFGLVYYFHGRFIKVMTDDVVGKPFNVNCGAPQGLVLRPLLFLICVGTMHFYLPNTVVTSFANDTALTVIGEFIKLSFLAVNIEKTNYMIFSRIGKVVNSCHSIILQDVSISQVFQCKYIGFYFDVGLILVGFIIPKFYFQNGSRSWYFKKIS